MPKQLINTIGAVIVAAILLAAIGLVAFPLFLQTMAVTAQSATVATQNAQQQAAVDALAAKETELPQLEAQVAELETEIPSEPHNDTISALVAAAAEETGVTVTNFAPSEPIPVDQTPGAEATVSGRVQIPIMIDATAPSLDHMTAFLDALRAGDRLIVGLEPSISTGSAGSQGTISAVALALLPEQE